MKEGKLITKTGFTLFIFLVIFLSCVSPASQVTDRLSLWREHIVNKGNFGGVEFSSEHFRALVEMGPNSLPEVFEAYRTEEDPHVLNYYRILIERVAHFNFFRYSRKPLKVMGYQYQCTEDIPFLSMEVREKALPAVRYPKRAFMQKDKLIAWWDRRETFLLRTDFIDNVREITGNSIQQFRSYDQQKTRRFHKLRCFGIYNIPYFIDTIEQDNNPIIFCEFLRTTNHQLYQQLEMGNGLTSDIRKVSDLYPTSSAKIALICDWWSDVNKTYSNLEQLFSQIDTRVKKFISQ